MAGDTPENPLNERAQHLLKALIERYIRDGQPVGSRTLSRDAGLDLSPASIRNVMADLDDLGLVCSPHTSAGRVPTVKGYRVFVDSLLTIRPLNTCEVKRIEQQLTITERPNSQALLASASQLLSGITKLAGVVSVPSRPHISWRQIEFLSLSENRILAILVFNDGEVQNRILNLDRPYRDDELQQAANYLNQHFAGREIADIRAAIIDEMRSTRESMNEMMLTAIQMAEHVCDGTALDEGYVLAGQTNLMDFAELSDVEKLRRLFEAFNKKRDILHLLDKCGAADGVQIFIGEESGYKVLDECSVVTAPYAVDDELIGVLGVIGPTRMAYERVIPIVDMTAKLLSAALNTKG
ncbi:MAG: heat-inducible transcriptional repressor HrcA [Gammaproteobacteria bacterium]|nr:heat-inducible transcriptional repressor HrcA [Gammaproteobacteria bacterium]